MISDLDTEIVADCVAADDEWDQRFYDIHLSSLRFIEAQFDKLMALRASMTQK